eukprot:m.48843 g.48843  ORF g.48843 m.48843 type:complete len:51 (+) comp17844_c1_seq1:162-314(+)
MGFCTYNTHIHKEEGRLEKLGLLLELVGLPARKLGELVLGHAKDFLEFFV